MIIVNHRAIVQFVFARTFNRKKETTLETHIKIKILTLAPNMESNEINVL